MTVPNLTGAAPDAMADGCGNSLAEGAGDPAPGIRSPNRAGATPRTEAVSGRQDLGDAESPPQTDQPPALLIENVSKTYFPSPPWLRLLLKSAIQEPVAALTDVSFTLERGEACVVVGPNGAGKSTLFRVLTGLTTPTSGAAQVMGHDIGQGRQVRSMIGYMPAEDRNLMLRHTCAQNLAFRGTLQDIPRRQLLARIDEVLDQVGLLHVRDHAATSLSTGMRARLQLAAALLHHPDLLVLDEPTSAVDPVGAHELLLLIERLSAEHGLTVVLSSHRLEEIDALDDKVVFLDHGRVIHDGNLGELRRLWEVPRHRLTFQPTVDVVSLGRRLATQSDFEVDVVANAVEVATNRPVGDVLAAVGPAVAGMESLDQVVMPLRELFHKLVNGEIEGLR